MNLAKNLFLSNNEKLRYAFATIFAETRDPTTRSKLQPSLDAVNQSTQELSTLILDQMLVPYAQKPSYATFSSVRDATIKSHFDLWDASIGELSNLLQQRINRFEQQRLIVFVISGLIIASVVYLLFGFYRAVMNTIGGFQPAAQAMLEGKELQTVNVATRDELGRVAVSFNAIA